MLLLELTRLYKKNRKVMPILGWEFHWLRWVIIIDKDGDFCDILDLATHENPKGIMTHLPKKIARTNNAESCQLWDHSGYVLGVGVNNPKKAARLHEDFVTKCQLIANETGDSGAKAVALFVANIPVIAIGKHPFFTKLLNAGAISFRLESDDVLVINRPTVHQWLTNNPLSSDTKPGQCMVCGQRGNIERLLPTIKFIRGCDASGVRLTAINNSRSGHSCLGAYGLEQGFCAPTCEQCSHQCSNALNYLLRPGSHNKIYLGQFTLLYWCPQSYKIELLFRKIILGGQGVEQVKDKNRQIRLKPNPRFTHWVPEPSCKIIEQLKQSHRNGYINVLIFKGKDRRVAVLHYQRIPLTEFIKNSCRWVACIAQPTAELTPLSLFLSTLSQNKDLDHLRSDILISFLAALALGSKLNSLFVQLSAYTQRKYPPSPSSLHRKLVRFMSSQLQESHKNSKPYLCGQLLATLIKCQEEANGESTTIRCDAVTVAAPARLMTSYLTKNRRHLSIIGKENFGRRVNLEQIIQKLVAKIDIFPELLDPDEQLIFFSGYYSQRAAFFTKE